MATNLRFKYDREADILHIDKCPSYAEREAEKLKDEVIARLNPDTGEVENQRGAVLLDAAAADGPVRIAGHGQSAAGWHGGRLAAYLNGRATSGQYRCSDG